jgi:hypothetical protein
MRITRCRSCDENIVWMRTAKGKSMPVDADSVDEDDLDHEDDGTPKFDYEKHTSHFSTCPNADSHRRG